MAEMKFSEEEKAILQEDRQWLRVHRLKRAKEMVKHAKTKRERSFWHYVTKLNTVEIA